MSVARSFDNLVEKYHQFYSCNPEYNYFIEEIVELVKRGKILDLGCGTGVPVMRDLTKHGYEVVGVDFSRKMVEAAKKNVPKAQVYCEDMLKFNLEKNSYDGAIAFFSINHLTKKEMVKLFSRLLPAIKDDGGILIGAIEGDFEGHDDILGESTFMRHTKEEEIIELLVNFDIVKIERREFIVEGEPLQNQIFILARKKTAAELYDEANKKEENEKKAKEDEKQEKHSKKEKHTKSHIKKIESKEYEDEHDRPIIKISLFGKK